MMPASKQSTFDTRHGALQETVQNLLEEARQGVEERRAEKREPFFAPVLLSLPYEGARQFTVYSRDVSATGIGLLHFMSLERGAVVLSIPSGSRGKVRVLSEIVWCQPCGDGWYLSGARFLELLPPR
jgi:hypothetical protein